MWYEWFFDGIGTEIIVLIIGLLVGGFSGYKVGIKKNGTQKQIARSEAKQKQELYLKDNNVEKGGINGNFRQMQKAGKKSEQNQIGRIQ